MQRVCVNVALTLNYSVSQLMPTLNIHHRFVHFALFFIMIAFVIQVLVMIREGTTVFKIMNRRLRGARLTHNVFVHYLQHFVHSRGARKGMG